MNVEISESNISEYANQRMKQLVDQKVKERLAEIQWYKTVDNAVFDVVRQEITVSIIKNILDKIDRKELVSTISTSLADMLVSKIYED